MKGSGASTVEEAYSAVESPIVLSLVEDWDLEGSFAMDDKGNFIVLSTGRLEFDGAAAENRKVKVLASRGLTWSVEYIPDNDESASAFSAVRLSDSSLSIGAVGQNPEDKTLSGKFVVTANVPDGGNLSVDITVVQNPVDDKPTEPEIPDNLPFALVPTSYERVKIDHNEKTIEIDAFDPDCFNSFIDIPFTVYFNKSLVSDSQISIYSDFEWPLEGQISKTPRSDLYYCSESFGTTLSNKYSVYSSTKKALIPHTDAFQSSFKAADGDVIYISVGAMAPDDPAIVKTITLISGLNPQKVEYKLMIKPRSVIIDDVILSDGNNYWLVFDRNVQDINNSDFKNFVSRQNGDKLQAYNYLTSTYPITIPNKYVDANTTFNESRHELYKGYSVKFGDRYNILSTVPTWIPGYVYASGQERTSPFYEQDNYGKWALPTLSVLELCAKNIRVSKMRMFLVSDVYVKAGADRIPVCCYWPFRGDAMDKISLFEYSDGYYASDNSGIPTSLIYIYCDKTEVKTHILTSTDKSKYPGLSRLVRPLTADELEAYKTGYLGYGSQPHKLTVCHPDTYESKPFGWLPY